MAMLKPSLDDLIRSSVRSILKNKGRTILTSLGIIIGVTSVILLTSIGTGLKKYVSDQFDSLGANTVFIVPGKVFNEQGGFSGGERRLITTTFSNRDTRLLKRGLKTSIVMPLVQAIVDVKSSTNTKKDISIIGSTYQYGPSSNLAPSNGNGRWFTKEEEEKSSNVVVLGFDTANDLFPSGNAIGKKIIIKGKNLRVIGINDKKGSTFGGPSLDDQIFVPLDVARSISGKDDINSFSIKANDKDEVSQVKENAKKILSKYYEEDAFSVFDSSQLLNSINSIIGTLTIALTGIAAISLVVGGIGIMNIMLVTVTERTREIGLRKAIGAYPRAILIQFLIEAIILSCLGGAIGILLGTLGTIAINRFFPAAVTPGSIITAFGVSSLVGIIFGVAPARKASKLSPIEALRYE